MGEPALNLDYRAIGVHPLATWIGAEISGVDLASGPSDEQMAEIRRAFADYSVIFFRDNPMTPEQHIAFARRWGEIDVNRFFAAVPGQPLIAEVRKEPEQLKNIGSKWHTDHSYDVAPALGSVLHAREVPAVGGDTLFASMYAAYEALSPGMKRLLHSLEAEHSSRHVFGHGVKDPEYSDRLGNSDAATQDSAHPVVIRHPDTGRPALYVNPGFTLRFRGWTDAESHDLLEQLYQHATQPEFTCRFRWRAGSTALWDNRSVWHYALNDYHGQRRLMHRITIAGTPLSAAQLQ